MESLYRAILGVSETASEEEVAKAYIKLTINQHPDGNPEVAGKLLPGSLCRELPDTGGALPKLMVNNGMPVGLDPVAHGVVGLPGVAAEGWALLHGTAPELARIAVSGGCAPTRSGGAVGAAGSEATDDVFLSRNCSRAAFPDQWCLLEHQQQGKQEADAWPTGPVYTAACKLSQSWVIEDSDSGAERVYKARQYALEDPERRNKRLAAQAARAAKRRAEETLEQRAKRLAADAARAARKRAEEDLERRAQRLKADAARAARKRAEEDPQRRAARRAAQAARAAQRRAEEDPETRAKRLAADAARAARKRAEEDPERRAQRLKADAERAARRRAEEDPERRAARCAAQAERAARRRAEARGRHTSVGAAGSPAGTEDASQDPEVETGADTVVDADPGRGWDSKADLGMEAEGEQDSDETVGTEVTENEAEEVEERQRQRQGMMAAATAAATSTEAAAGSEGTGMRDLALPYHDQTPAVDEVRCGHGPMAIGNRTTQSKGGAKLISV
ncbi:hypothetical protein Vretifemale_12423 [Volvox reticuliferus]|uniref:J domain-containing protein n=1 Tax=Volvox reticuliferus TaxID=1737510 RepID=A0A8J4CKU5_9CHLO|nr:hypothetical protein Vretifemale_12423 [Volvox reticuliferus]